MKRIALATLVAGVWLSLSEFLRNEFLFKQFWIDHYESLGMTFPSAPANGAIWGLWAFIVLIAQRILGATGAERSGQFDAVSRVTQR